MGFEVDIAVRRGTTRITAAFAAGEGLTVLFGPSGAGKTTVLDAVAGLAHPERGHIRAGETMMFDAAAGIDVRPEQRACGYVFQDGRLFPHRTVRDNLLFGWRLAPEERRRFDPAAVIGLLGIDHLLARLPRTLSGGEAQRVAIGRALLAGPLFLLMDEPLSSLDGHRREEIMTVIERIRDDLRLPILYVTHDPAEVRRLANQVVAIGHDPARADAIRPPAVQPGSWPRVL